MIELTQDEFTTLTSFVKVNFGLDLTEKRVFVQLRIHKMMREAGFDQFYNFFNHVCGDVTGASVAAMVSALTVNYTLFYRESFHFEYLTSDVLPYVYAKTQQTRDFRIWSAGCSTGEEPYTLGIVVSEFLGVQKPYWDMKILATDISTFVLEKAAAGQYPAASIENLNPNWVEKYFAPSPTDPEFVQVTPALQQEIIFRKHNLVKDPFLFKQKFQIIFCRNVMIYFDEPTKYMLLQRFYNYLEDGGFLFIGMSETIDHTASKFEYVMPSVYRKVGR